jgi:hypothetical protein
MRSPARFAEMGYLVEEKGNSRADAIRHVSVPERLPSETLSRERRVPSRDIQM